MNTKWEERRKLVFMVPNSYCGMFIGKKGANVKKMKGDAEAKVSINLSENPIQLPGANEVTTCTIYGNKEDTQNAIEQAAITLGDISVSMRANLQPKLPPPSYGGGFGRGLAGPSYGGVFGEDPDSRGGREYMGGLGGAAGGYKTRGEVSGFGKGGGERGYESRVASYGSGDASQGSGRRGWANGGGSDSRGGWGGGGGSGTRGGWGSDGRN